MILCQKMWENPGEYEQAYNFGPSILNCKSVKDMVEEAYITWSGEWETIKEIDQPHETEMLQLSIDKTVTQ